MSKKNEFLKNFNRLLILFLIVFHISSNLYAERPKVGLVLMGGGAKGFAHVGALKVIEEVGIPIDYIAGTSMGAIIGGLYSIGYSADAIDSLIQNQDWLHLLTDEIYRYNLSSTTRDKAEKFIISLSYEREGIVVPSGIIEGHNIFNLLLDLTTNYHEQMDFNDLPIPFSCIAADIYSGDEVVLNRGSLPLAMRSSMAIPGVFSPVKKDSLLLIDGGIINNFPVDVVKEMGADIVIGVHFEKDEIREELAGSIMAFAHNLNNFMGKEKYNQNVEDTDLPIKVNLGEFTVASFRKQEIDSIITIGEATTRSHIEELRKFRDNLNLTTENRPPKIINSYIGEDSLKLSSVQIEGLNDIEIDFILKNFPIKLNTTKTDLHNTIANLYGTELFSKVHYRLENPQPPYDLILEIEKENFNSLNIGVRFDNIDRASILLDTDFRLRESYKSKINVTTRLNSSPYFTLDYSLYRSMAYKGNLRLKASFNDIDIYEKGDIAYNLGFYTYSANLNFSGFYFYKMKVQLGANIKHYHHSYELKKSLNKSLDLKSKPLISYYVNGNYDNLDRRHFPTKGVYFDFIYQLISANLYDPDNKKPIQDFRFTLTKPIKLDDKITITGNLKGRSLISDNIPFILSNMVGGQWDCHYTNQQIALEGLKGMEVMSKSVLKAELSFKYNFHRRHGLQADFNYTFYDNKPFHIINDKAFWGSTLGYIHSTIVGPVIIRLNYSERTHKIYPFINVGYLF